jgi:anti-sigma B factor antagonist
MNLTCESHLAATVVSLSGELTADNCDTFQRYVRETLDNSKTNIILDCGNLEHIDSLGLESFLWLSDELNRNGNKLKFAAVSESVQTVFKLTRLERVFSTHKTVEAAARSFS